VATEDGVVLVGVLSIIITLLDEVVVLRVLPETLLEFISAVNALLELAYIADVGI
jgi:hypothetical protein